MKILMEKKESIYQTGNKNLKKKKKNNGIEATKIMKITENVKKTRMRIMKKAKAKRRHRNKKLRK